jgi:hypothetical protein
MKFHTRWYSSSKDLSADFPNHKLKFSFTGLYNALKVYEVLA